MKREILLNAFDMNTVGHQSFGLWRHPRDKSEEHGSPQYWIDLAKTLEQGLFDGLFLADVLGTYDVYGGNADASIETATQFPVHDPMMAIPLMALETENLCFGVTASLSHELPVPFARRMSTLDHLTNGRVGWNIVTGYLESSAKAAGKVKQADHDVRYDIAHEYMEIMYGLWEESWSESALKRDRASGVFTDPSRISPVRHDGEYLKVDSLHLCDPSPQRTPVLYQAGASPKGRDFAAQHAECIFVVAPTRAGLKGLVADLRERAVKQGRNAADLKIFAALTVIPGSSEAEAAEKHAEYKEFVSHEGALAVLSGWTKIDFSRWNLSDTLTNEKVEAIQGIMDAFTADPGRIWTVREIAEKVAIGGPSPLVVGGPEKVVDELEQWVAETDVDGFNLFRVVAPESFVDFVDLIVPEMQRRGIYKTGYDAGTYRRKLFGRGDHLEDPHPAARYRRR